MKVAYITKGLLTGGAETNICDLSEWFVANGWDVEVVIFTDSSAKSTNRLRDKGVRVVFLGGKGYVGILRSLAEYLNASDADVIHAHMPLANQICRVLRVFLKFRLVTTEHNVWCRIHPLHRLVAPVLVHLDALSLACSPEVARSFPYPLRVNSNGRNFSEFAEAANRGTAALPALDEERIIYLNVANINKKKNHVRLLESFRLVPEFIQGKKTYLLIAGAPGDNWTEVEDFVRKHSLGRRVLLLGAREDVPALMRRADVFVLTSDHEGMPLTVLEAMYMGLPVVCTPVGELPVMLQHTDWVVHDQSPTSIASRMISILTSGTTPGFVEQNKCVARTLYSIHRQASELETFYRNLVQLCPCA